MQPIRGKYPGRIYMGLPNLLQNVWAYSDLEGVWHLISTTLLEEL